MRINKNTKIIIYKYRMKLGTINIKAGQITQDYKIKIQIKTKI